MRRTKLGPAIFFKLFVAAAAFALGLAAAGLWPRQTAAPVPPPAPAPPAQAVVTVRDTPSDSADEESGGPSVYEGSYRNYTYGYSVEIPAGMVGMGSTPPAPQHGFVINLDSPRSTRGPYGAEAPKSHVYVDGSYNSLEWEQLEDAAGFNFKWRHKCFESVRQVSREWTRLGGLRALRVVLRYESDGVEMVNDETVAFRTEGKDPSPVYTLDLDTPLSKYERDRPVLEALLKGWRLQSIE